MSIKQYRKSGLLTCSEDVTARLLGCTRSEIAEKEKAGQLTHISLWRDHGLAKRSGGFFGDYWKNYDVRHFSVEEVLSLMPEHSQMADYLRTLMRRNRHVQAGQIALGASLPYVWTKMSQGGAISNPAPFARARGKASPSPKAARTSGR